MISKNGTLTAVVATVGAVNEQKAVTALQKSIAAQPELKANSWLGGPTVAGVQIAERLLPGPRAGGALCPALLLLLLFFVFRGLRAAAVPLVGAVFAIAVTLGVMGLALILVPLSIFALNLVIALGIGLSVDFSLLIISRFREEFARDPSIETALATVRRTAAHTVLFSTLTIAAALATLAVFPERFVYSMGIAGAIVVLAAGAFALLVLPSMLTVFGERMTGRAPTSATEPTSEIATGRRWYAMATRVMRRPVIWAGAALLVLVLLASPFLHVAFTGGDASALPASSSAGTAYTLIQDRVPALSEATGGCPCQLEHGVPDRARQVRNRTVPCVWGEGRAGLRPPRWVALGVQRDPFGCTAVAGGPAGRRGPPACPAPAR